MIRKARIDDVKQMHKIINKYASENKMLPRSLNDLYEHIRDFIVYVNDNDEVKGCCAVHVVWDNLAEIKALAVSSDYFGKGIGRDLVEECFKEARALGISKLFTLTYVTDFFKKLDFYVVDRDDLPHKIWRECIHCPKFPDCDETAMIKDMVIH